MALKKKHTPEDFSTKEFKVYFPFETKDVACTVCGAMPCVCEEETGKVIQIKGFANFCGNLNDAAMTFIDHSGDVMVPSGFDLSVWNKNPQVLWQHNRDYTIGKGLQATKQANGLEVTCEIHEKAMEEQDFYKIDKGLVTMFSVGFRTLKGEYKEIDGREVFFITKALLYEVSVVSIPANSESQFTRIKSMEDGNFSAGDIYLSPESSSAKDAVNKTVSEDHVKLKLRDMLSEDKVKELEDLGMGASLDELQEVDTKAFIEALVSKEVQAEVKKALDAFKAEQTEAAEAEVVVPAEEEVPASEEEPITEEEAIPEETEEEKAINVEYVKSLSESIATLKALVEEK
jgi:HK97 family phage prohead protease